MPEHTSAFYKQPVVAGRDADRPVRGLEHLIWHQRKAGAAETLRRLAGVVVTVERPLHPGHRAVEQRGVDHAALAGAMPRLQRAERTDHAPLRSGAVVDCGRAKRRRIVGPAGQRHHAAISLQQRIESGCVTQRAVLAERPHRAIDQPRIERTHHIGPDPEFGNDAGAQILDQDVG